MKLKCRFGVPEHGWLLVQVLAGDYTLEMDVSDVPVNPIDQLIESLCRVLYGMESEVWWHLEPASYYFSFSRSGTTKYRCEITFAKGNKVSDPRRDVLTVVGNVNEVIFPFWRAIREFMTYEYEEPRWPKTDAFAVEKLTELVRSVK